MGTDTIIAIFGVGFGVFCYFTSGILRDKKDAIESKVELKNALDDIHELKTDFRNLEKRFNDYINN